MSDRYAKMKAAFEKQQSNRGMAAIYEGDGHYKHPTTQREWENWQDAWQAATEAAKATGTAGEVEHIHSPDEQADIGKRIRRVAKASGYVPDGTDEFYYAAAFAILGRAADALEQAARQPAPVMLSDDEILMMASQHGVESREFSDECVISLVRAALAATNRTQPEATAPPPELMGYWYWDEGGLRDAPEWRMGGIKRPPADWPKNKRLNLYAGAPAQDLSAAILAIDIPSKCLTHQAAVYGFEEGLKAAAALASSANALSAGDRVDAERYQALRGALNGYHKLDGEQGVGQFNVSLKIRSGEAWYLHGEELDKHIDAAILQSQKGNKV